MRCLSIQIQPEFLATFDQAEFLSRIRDLRRSPEIDRFTEHGKSYLSFNFFTEMPVQLWRDLQQHLYLHPEYSATISACSIAFCEGEQETDEAILLHHPDPNEQCDLLR